MKKILLSIFAFLSLCSFSTDPRYIKLADRLASSYVRQLKAEKGFSLAGYGGSMMYDVKQISFSFIAFDHLDVEGARKLYVEVIEGLLNKVNRDEKIRPYLHNYPFTQENVDIDVGFEDAKRQKWSDGSVSLIFITRKNIISYRAYDQEKQDYYGLHEETYDEALKIVRGEKIVKNS